jgi:hypothetical protein
MGNFIVQTLIYGILLILFTMGVIYVYKYFRPTFKKNPKILLENSIILEDPNFKIRFTPNDIPLPNIEKGDQLGVSFGFRVYLENAMENEKWGSRFDKLKQIIDFSPSIYYHPYDNYFEFGVEVKDNIQMTSIETLKYKDPPLQKWLNFIVVFSSTKIQVYIDNVLITSKKIKNPPIIKPRYLQIGEENNNVKGELGKIMYWPYPLDSSEIFNANKILVYG